MGSHPLIWSTPTCPIPSKSPPEAEASCIQQSIFADSDSPMIGPDERGGIDLRACRIERDGGEIHQSIKVTGTSGLSYLRRPNGAMVLVSLLADRRTRRRMLKPFEAWVTLRQYA